MLNAESNCPSACLYFWGSVCNLRFYLFLYFPCLMLQIIIIFVCYCFCCYHCSICYPEQLTTILKYFLKSKQIIIRGIGWVLKTHVSLVRGHGKEGELPLWGGNPPMGDLPPGCLLLGQPHPNLSGGWNYQDEDQDAKFAWHACLWHGKAKIRKSYLNHVVRKNL